ncbi:hypothetical protein J3F83DRAFT_754876 [Trichoderma novae-zelandiae]
MSSAGVVGTSAGTGVSPVRRLAPSLLPGSALSAAAANAAFNSWHADPLGHPPPTPFAPGPGEGQEAEVDDDVLPWDPPCENCVRGVISGKGGFDQCVDSSGRSRWCAACKASNHQCVPLRPLLLPLALKLVQATNTNDESMALSCRRALRLQMKLLDAHDPVYREEWQDPSLMTEAEIWARAAKAWKSVGDWVFWG